MERLLSLSYFFTPRPSPDFPYTKLTLAVFALLFLGGIAIGIYRKKFLKDEIWKKILRRYPGILVNYAVTLLILLVIRETGMPYLSMRIWWALWFVALLYSIARFLLTCKKQYETRAEKLKINRSKDAYLPRKKKK